MQFRTAERTWNFEGPHTVYNEENGIRVLDFNKDILLKKGYMPILREGGYIDIVRNTNV